MANDYRGYLYQLAKGGNTLAGDALAFVGNDGGINEQAFSNYGFDTPHKNPQELRNFIRDTYGTYGGSVGRTKGLSTTADGGGTAPTVDPNAVALYEQGIGQTNSALGRLGNQEQIGLENVANDYQAGRNRLNTARANAEGEYNTTKNRSIGDNVVARDQIRFQTGQRANALQRLLGSRGAGSSSAARVVAPYATAMEGTQQLGDVGQTFSRNMADLDQNWTNYQTNWNESAGDLDRQKMREENAVRSGVAEKRSSLLQALANLQSQRTLAAGGNAGAAIAAARPMLDQVNQLGTQIDNYGRQYAGRVQAATPQYTAPNLEAYDYDQAAQARLGGGQNVRTDAINPYLALLLGSRREERRLA